MTTSERRSITGPAIPVRGNDIDTDRIIPARFLKCVVFDGLGAEAFADDRTQLRARGETHPFDDPRWVNARILLVNRNFGCGSSREHAPQALMRWGHGIQAIVGESFAEIFAGNCLALGIPCATVTPEAVETLMTVAERAPETPFTLSVVDRTITAGAAAPIPVDIPDGTRHQLVAGAWDTTAELLAARDRIAETAARLPYVAVWGGDGPSGS
jgi:3-isopropylmalate/(R)-2-methylmalate dehydratase small subunit